MIFNMNWHDNSRPDGTAVLEIAGTGGPARAFIPLVRTSIGGTLAGPLASLAVTHVFRYTEADNPRVIEALYRFPLPGDAAVTAVDVKFGLTTISTRLKERKTAEREYDDAKKEGKSAALLTRESPDVFTLHIAGIAPGEEVRVTTQYVEAGMPEKSGFAFRIPLTTAPRYVRTDEQHSRHARGQPLAVLRDPGHRFSLDITCGGEGSVESPTHRLSVSDQGQVSLADGEVIPDRDCVLVWRPALHGSQPACQVFSDGTHFLALVTPPAQAAEHFPRDVIILVDHSGSMNGAKRDAADWAVERFIAGLTDRDRFNLCLFESNTWWLSRQPVRADREHREIAIRFLKDTHSGGTELGMALEQALSQERTAGRVSRHVIVITDAEVTDMGRILRLVDTEARHPRKRRVSVICIDAAPNSTLAQQAAERGGGIARYLTSSPQEEDITSTLDDILSLWDAPVATGLTLSVNRKNLFVDRRRVKTGADGRCHIDIGDLPAGRSTWVVARAPPAPDSLTFALHNPDHPSPPVTIIPHPAVSALFGARLVAELEFLMHAGYSVDQLQACLQGLGYSPPHQTGGDRVYAENRMQESMDIVKDLVARESLNYGILSSETAFVAVRSTPGRTVEEQVLVPNALPHGWSEAFMTQGLMKTSIRRGVEMTRKGSPLEWVGGGDMIMQWDGTMQTGKKAGKESQFLLDDSGRVSLPMSGKSASLSGIISADTGDHTGYPLYSGVPDMTGGGAVLYDSTRSGHAGMVPETALLKRLEIVIRGQRPGTAGSLTLLIYIGDPALPRVRILLSDLLLHNGVRPLNIQRRAGEFLRIILVDPEGRWKTGAPEMKVFLR